MSAIASFIKLPISYIPGLQEAAVPSRVLGVSQDNYHNYLDEQREEVADYSWSGYLLATVLVYLEQHHEIYLMKSEFDELSAFLTSVRGNTTSIFTEAHKRTYLAELNGDFSESELCTFYNEFNDTSETEIGTPLLEGIRALAESLNQLDETSVIVFAIG